MEQEIKILFLLFMSLAGVIFYMVVAHDTGPIASISAAALAAVVALVSLIELKRNPVLLLHVATTTALALSIISGVTWYYTRGWESGMVAAISTPVAVGLAIWSVLLPRRRNLPGPGQTQR